MAGWLAGGMTVTRADWVRMRTRKLLCKLGDLFNFNQTEGVNFPVSLYPSIRHHPPALFHNPLFRGRVVAVVSATAFCVYRVEPHVATKDFAFDLVDMFASSLLPLLLLRRLFLAVSPPPHVCISIPFKHICSPTYSESGFLCY